MKIVKIACLSAALLGSTLSFAQSDDLGMYTSVEVSRKIVSKLEVSLEEEFRLRDNLNEIDRFSTALQLSYKFCPYLKAGGAYNLINYNHPTKDWEIRHRYYFFVQGSYEFNRFTNMSALLYTGSIMIFLMGLISEQITALMYKEK